YDNDLDLGSCGPILLPTQTNSSTPNLILTSGKDEDIYLLNQNSMGGYNTANNDQIVQYIPATLLGELHGSPLFWNNYAYFLAQQDYLRAYQLSTNSSTGVTSLTTTPVVETSSKLTTQGFPSISANGNTNGIVWVVRNVKSVPKLSAYDAMALLLLYDSGQAANGRDTLGIIGHGAVPTIANGKVYAGTQTQLVVYGLFNDIAATAGGGQTAAAGTTLPTALTVLANNPYTGQPISGVSVTFSDGGVGGTFGSPTVITGSNGQASTSYTLPKTPKNISITATSTGYASASFVETGVVGPVASIATISGSKQTGPVGTTLPNPIVVKAKDAFGNLEVGAQISFSDGYGGIFSPNPSVTGTNGEASVTYTLPTVAKTLTVSATNGSVTDKITEAATADPPALVNIIQGNNQTAHVKNKLPKTLIVSVTDQYNNGLSGLTVNFTDNGAGGTFSNPNPVTGTTGQVTVTYTTGPNEGTVTIDATYSTLAPAVFTETVD
ncbi:MAG: Ig-like domain-containing protein, partial [Candidatus Sulfotelmatobacter sp.]